MTNQLIQDQAVAQRRPTRRRGLRAIAAGAVMLFTAVGALNATASAAGAVEPMGTIENDGPPPGCSVQCMTYAKVTAANSPGRAHVSVKSNTAAKFIVQVSKQPPTYQNGKPKFELTNGGKSTADYAMSWETDLNGLEPDTKYYGIISATDADYNTAYATGSFTTASVNITIGMLEVKLSYDGDSGSLDRGELSYAWGVGNVTVGTRGEEKMSAPETVHFARPQSIYTLFDVKAAPPVYVDASERDGDALAEFCGSSGVVAHEPGSDGSCDAKWNVAVGKAKDVAAIAKLPTCQSMGFTLPPEERCELIFSAMNLGDDYARFHAAISYRVTVAS